MKGRRKWLINLLFLAILTGVTLLAMLRGRDLGDLLEILRDADDRWLIPGVGLMILFILGESVVIHHMLRKMQSPLPFSRCALCSFVGFFFSCVTPFAGGGQPAQVLFLRRHGVSSAKAVPMLVLVTITYKLVLVVYGAAVFLLRPEPVWTALDSVRTWCLCYLWQRLWQKGQLISSMQGGCELRSVTGWLPCIQSCGSWVQISQKNRKGC